MLAEEFTKISSNPSGGTFFTTRSAAPLPSLHVQVTLISSKEARIYQIRDINNWCFPRRPQAPWNQPHMYSRVHLNLHILDTPPSNWWACLRPARAPRVPMDWYADYPDLGNKQSWCLPSPPILEWLADFDSSKLIVAQSHYYLI